MERRNKFRQGLSILYLPFYEDLCDALTPEWQPYSGYRTFEEQTRLWDQGRQSPGKIVTNAKAGESAHNWGCGSDWTIWENDKPVWMSKDDTRWSTYFNAIRLASLKMGADFGDVDHNELRISCSWPAVLAVYNQNNNMTQAQKKIEESMECPKLNGNG